MTDPHLDVKRAILAAALAHAGFDGWSDATLRAAAAEAGVSAGRARLAFPAGAPDLVAFYVAEADRRMAEALREKDLPSMKIRERITTAIRTRLEQAEGERDAVRRAAALFALPQNAGLSLRSLYGTVDAMWRAAGDTSTDHNFYTKRLTLAAVYSSVLLYWLGDDSEGRQATWAFLDRRIQNVMDFEKFKARLPDLGGVAEAPLRLLGALRYAGPARRPVRSVVPRPGARR